MTGYIATFTLTGRIRKQYHKTAPSHSLCMQSDTLLFPAPNG